MFKSTIVATLLFCSVHFVDSAQTRCKFRYFTTQMRGKQECSSTPGCAWDTTKNAEGGGECSEIVSTCKFKDFTTQMRGRKECSSTPGCAWDTTRNVRGGGECSEMVSTCKFKDFTTQMRGRKECSSTPGCAWDTTKNAKGGGECSEMVSTCKFKDFTTQMRGRKECSSTPGCAWDTTRNVRGGGECSDIVSPNTQCNNCLSKRGNLFVTGYTWCWKSKKCYPTGAFYNPCSNSNCASVTPGSTCSLANSNCDAPSGY
jgi:hypothetical protein